MAALIWASYAGLLGYIAGETFDHTTAFYVAFATAIGVTVLIEAARWFRDRNKPQPSPTA